MNVGRGEDNKKFICLFFVDFFYKWLILIILCFFLVEVDNEMLKKIIIIKKMINISFKNMCIMCKVCRVGVKEIMMFVVMKMLESNNIIG